MELQDCRNKRVCASAVCHFNRKWSFPASCGALLVSHLKGKLLVITCISWAGDITVTVWGCRNWCLLPASFCSSAACKMEIASVLIMDSFFVGTELFLHVFVYGTLSYDALVLLIQRSGEIWILMSEYHMCYGLDCCWCWVVLGGFYCHIGNQVYSREYSAPLLW